jgi:hypothetical protein
MSNSLVEKRILSWHEGLVIQYLLGIMVFHQMELAALDVKHLGFLKCSTSESLLTSFSDPVRTEPIVL